MTAKDPSERNMYGCMPCPKCGSRRRWVRADLIMLCDDCCTAWRAEPDVEDDFNWNETTEVAYT